MRATSVIGQRSRGWAALLSRMLLRKAQASHGSSGVRRFSEVWIVLHAKAGASCRSVLWPRRPEQGLASQLGHVVSGVAGDMRPLARQGSWATVWIAKRWIRSAGPTMAALLGCVQSVDATVSIGKAGRGRLAKAWDARVAQASLGSAMVGLGKAAASCPGLRC